MQLIGSNERFFGITWTDSTLESQKRSHANCECFTFILHMYVLIRLHHLLRDNNEILLPVMVGEIEN